MWQRPFCSHYITRLYFVKKDRVGAFCFPHREGAIMAVKTYSLAKDGNTKLSENFAVKEFRCWDGSDTILISGELVDLLQLIRLHFGKPVLINSAYRTKTHNTAVGGSSRSQHMLGTAADIHIMGVPPLEVAQYAEKLMPDSGGIGLYNVFTHVDVRTKRTRWDSTGGVETAVDGFTVDWAAKVKERFGFEDQTIEYLGGYKFADSLMEKLATKE